MTSRRDFLKALFAAPAIVRAGLLMPVRSFLLPASYLPGDLVSTLPGSWVAVGAWHPASPVRRVEGDNVIVSNGCYGKYAGEDSIPARWLKLFEGLPGNRVDNPSMRHRLKRVPGTVALAYPGDFSIRDAGRAALGEGKEGS